MLATIRKAVFFPVRFTVQQLMFILAQIEQPEISGEDPRWKDKVDDAISALSLERKVIQQQNQRSQILEDKISRLSSQLQTSSEKFIQKEGELTEANYQLEAQKKKENDLKNKFENQIHQMKDDFFKEKTAFESMIRDLKSSNQALNQSHTKLKAEFESLKKREEEIEKEAKREVSEIEHSLQLERFERSKLERAIHGMRTGLEHRETLKQCLEQELSKADDRYQFLKLEADQMKEQSKGAKQDYEKLNQKVHTESKQLKSKIHELENQLKGVQNQFNESKNQLKESQLQLTETEHQLKESNVRLNETVQLKEEYERKFLEVSNKQQVQTKEKQIQAKPVKETQPAKEVKTVISEETHVVSSSASN